MEKVYNETSFSLTDLFEQMIRSVCAYRADGFIVADKKLEENTKMVNSNFEEIAKISDTNLEENCIP